MMEKTEGTDLTFFDANINNRLGDSLYLNLMYDYLEGKKVVVNIMVPYGSVVSKADNPHVMTKMYVEVKVYNKDADIIFKKILDNEDFEKMSTKKIDKVVKKSLSDIENE